MTSLKFSYSLKLFKESLKQNRHIMTMHIILLLLATLLPAQIAVADITQIIKEYPEALMSIRSEYTYYISGFSFFTMMVMCLSTFATMSFSYLYNTRSTIFYGSLPYKKGTMFFARYLSGIISLLIPVLICYIINGIIFLNHSELLGGVNFWWYTQNWLFVALTYILIYSLCTFAASLSCNVFAQLIIMGAMILVYPSVVFILSESVNVMMKSYMVEYRLNAFYLFPPFATVFYGSGVNFVITSIIAIAESVILTGLGYFAYIKRKAEKVNNFFAYRSITGILKYFITFLVSTSSALLLAAVNRNNISIAYVGYIVFGFVSYAIIQMIFEKSPKAMFKNMKGLIIFLVIISLLASIPVFDALGLEKKMPNAQNLKKVSITKIDSASTYWHGGTEIVLTEPESIKAACELFAKGNTQRNFGYQFKLKEGYSIFTRRTYNLSNQDITIFLKSVYDNKDYKEAIKIDKEKVFNALNGNGKIYYNFFVNKNSFYDNVRPEARLPYEQLVAAYNKDVDNTKAEDIDFAEFYAVINTPTGDAIVFKEYKNTIEVLEREFLIKPNYEFFEKIELSNTDDDKVEYTITAPEKIKFIIDNVSDYYYEDKDSKGYHIDYETTDGEKGNNVAFVSESFLKKHNIL